VQEIDPIASHASWMENFPWTRIANVATPDERKPMVNGDKLKMMDPKKVREYLGDGNFGGLYRRSDDDMLALWKVAVEETRGVIEGPWL
jgi:creatinine amidohydrolase